MLLVLWVLTISSLAIFSAYNITSTIFNEIGKKAMLLAVEIAGGLEMEQADVDRYLSLDFVDLLKDPQHMEFEEKSRAVMKYSDIKYIYMETVLDDSRVKYHVEPGEEDLYGAPAGTPLNVVYLLDAVVSHETRMEDTDGQWYADKDRYINLDSTFAEIYKSDEPGYLFVEDRWGNYFTGYAPVYDSSGNLTGVLCVDLFLTDYYNLLKLDLIVVGGFTAANLAIGLILVMLFRRLRDADLKVQEKTIQSNTDYLTSCLNRRSFIETAKIQWDGHLRSGKPLAMLFVDIDFFKEYNDYYGHMAGDMTLCSVADVLNSCCNPSVSSVSRYGGDEFVIMLSNTDEHVASGIASNIIAGVAALNIPHAASPVAPYQTISIGVASLIPKNDLSVESLMDQADNALYKAKRYGRNQFQIWDGQSAKRHKSKTANAT